MPANTRLREALQPILNDYDFIIIDCPPSLGLLTVNALTASTDLLVPIQCEYYALEGVSQLLSTIRLIQKNLNPNLNIIGILLTMFDRRVNLSMQVAKEVRRYFKEKVFRTIIPRNIKLTEAPSFGKPIFLYDIRSPGAMSYLESGHRSYRKDVRYMNERLGRGLSALIPDQGRQPETRCQFGHPAHRSDPHQPLATPQDISMPIAWLSLLNPSRPTASSNP